MLLVMVFLDPTGNRWKKTKLTAAVAAGSLGVPVSILVAVALLTSPGWSPFSLPQPALKPELQSITKRLDIAPGVQPPQAVLHANSIVAFSPKNQPAVDNLPSGGGTVTVAKPEVSTPPVSSPTSQPQPEATPTNQPVVTTPPPVVATPAPEPSSSQPANPGNSDFGKSHKPVDPGSQGKNP